MDFKRALIIARSANGAPWRTMSEDERSESALRVMAQEGSRVAIQFGGPGSGPHPGSGSTEAPREGVKSISGIIKADPNKSIRILSDPNSDKGDAVEEIFKSSGINVSGIRDPLIYSKDEDGKINGGIMANTDGDFKVDIAVDKDARGQGVGESLLKGSIRYYAKNKDKLAEASGVHVDDYNMIVLPISTKMHPLLERLGFKQSGEEWTISSDDIEHAKALSKD